MTPVLIFEELRFPIEALFAALVFLLPFAEKKTHFRIKIVISFTLFMLFALLYFPIFKSKFAPSHYEFLGLWYPFIAFFPLFFSKINFKIGWCDAIFMTVSTFTLQNIVYVILHEFLARILFPSIREHLFVYILLSIIFCVFIYSIAYHLFSKNLSKSKHQLFEDTPRNIIFYMIFFFIIIVFLLHYQNLFENISDPYATNSWLLSLFLCIFILVIQFSLYRSQSFTYENALLEQILRNNDRYYHMSKESIEIINRKCHDLKHQIKVLSLINEQDRHSFIQETKEKINFYQNLVHSENEVINTILSEKGLFCEEKNIFLSSSVDNINTDFMKVTDLYAMLGNAIDNAIEYVDQYNDAEMRIISFRLSEKNNFINIQVVNPYRGPTYLPGILPSSSKNPDYHGFGLKSIQYLAKKYNGCMEISTADSQFTLHITLPTPFTKIKAEPK